MLFNIRRIKMEPIKKFSLFAVSAAALLIALVSCHTETPLGIDGMKPGITLLLVHTDTDTLYNPADTTLVFNDFEQSIVAGDYNFRFLVSDDQELYRLKFYAQDKITEISHELKTVNSPETGEVNIGVTYKDFPVVQDANPQEFFIYAQLFDGSENSQVSVKLGFNVIKVFPFDIFYDALGEIREIEGDSVDFREKNGKLAFIQFMSKGCLSCVEEAREMKAMYSDPSYDLEKYSHSLFGSKSFTEAEFLRFKTRDENLPFDCFWDSEGNYKAFFEGQIGRAIENEVFAVMPNGKIIIYNYLEGEYEAWIHSMYKTAYPNK
jgi:hypothetical protein